MAIINDRRREQNVVKKAVASRRRMHLNNCRSGTGIPLVHKENRELGAATTYFG